MSMLRKVLLSPLRIIETVLLRLAYGVVQGLLVLRDGAAVLRRRMLMFTTHFVQRNASVGDYLPVDTQPTDPDTGGGGTDRGARRSHGVGAYGDRW